MSWKDAAEQAEPGGCSDGGLGLDGSALSSEPRTGRCPRAVSFPEVLGRLWSLCVMRSAAAAPPCRTLERGVSFASGELAQVEVQGSTFISE